MSKDIDRIEKELERVVFSKEEILSHASLQLLQSGGKRIRPVFVLLGGKFGNYNIDQIKNVAVALELIHMASLVHDDVIDDANMRRGKPTINAKWGNRFAMYTGDYLFAQALQSITNIENPKAHQVLAQTILEVCKGEIEQIRDKYDFEQNLRCYLRRIKRKTALLIAVSCELGAIAAGAKEEVQRSLYWYGYYVGMSFQIIDDILDFVATEEQLGKPAGGDLLQGNVTLPVLFAMQEATLRDKITKVTEQTSTEEMSELIEGIKMSGAIEEAFEVSERYLQKALHSIKPLPRGQAKLALRSVAKYIGKRKF
ncbi:heptaprenyl diphosphate synthase component II [Priestia taiwanensis]|uniref:Heptaprenyl diphosphate synthase component 2 n=1 Tax=Priestia taiwanensis TaxID=1347902 RepID=A0A917EK96_9BACI|nr:heptaprenyl diphosphate synthase component II [Priestia taiwanensis]